MTTPTVQPVQPVATRPVRPWVLLLCLAGLLMLGAWGCEQASVATHVKPIAAYRKALVWDDEFSGKAGSRPSPARWEIETGTRDGMLQRYTGGTGSLSLDGDGHLVITARRGPSGTYTSGAIQTEGRFQTRYGKLEARIKLPSGQGLWPAFWALGSDYNQVGWPRSGEIDMMENFGNDPFEITGSIHGPWRTKHGYAVHRDARTGHSLAGGFHVYGVTWRPNAITFTLDGRCYATVTPRTLAPGQQWVFNKPFFLILNLAVTDQWAGSPSQTRFPVSMDVDWVRVYRLSA
jgi:beta-glucanase (GH16 family)